MKKLLFSSALTFSSLIATSSAIAGPGQPAGTPFASTPYGINTVNHCNTSSGECPVTPTKFSAKIYRVALCTSNPMALGETVVDWEGNGCVDVYNSTTGEETGDIFSETGATLSAENISIPTIGEYSYVAALFDKDFKVGSHHMVYSAAGGPLNSIRYVSTSTGGATAGIVGDEEMVTGEFNTFTPAIKCSDGANETTRTATTSLGNNSNYGSFLSGGESFYGRILTSNYDLATGNAGSINNNNAYCLGAKYLLSIVDKTTEITASTTGIHLKILAPNGLIRVDQGNAGNGVATGFSAHGDKMAVNVVPVSE